MLTEELKAKIEQQEKLKEQSIANANYAAGRAEAYREMLAELEKVQEPQEA